MTRFSGAIHRLERLVSGFSTDRDPIGEAITSLDNGTASLADLLGRARPPLAGTIDQFEQAGSAVRRRASDYFDATLQQTARALPRTRAGRSYGRASPTTSAGSPSEPAISRAAPSSSLDQTRDGEVRGKVMERYRGAQLIKSGVIGVILIILVVIVSFSRNACCNTPPPSVTTRSLLRRGASPRRQ